MAEIINQYSRLSHHTVTTSGTTFSVPTQEDFSIIGTTSAWTSTDLTLSEIGVNEADNKAYIRIGNNINEFNFGTSSGSTASLDYGTYIPLATIGLNLTSLTASQAKYNRVGDIVNVSGMFTLQPTLAVTTTVFSLSLPIASGITQSYDISGVAFSGKSAGLGAQIYGGTPSAVVEFLTSDTNEHPWSYTYQYKII